MRSYYLYTLTLLILVLFGCKKEQTTEPVQNINGTYVSSTFIEPGPSDGGVNIQSLGGSLRITLQQNNEFNAALWIPDSILTSYSAGYSTYSGTFIMNNDTINLNSSSFIINKIKWNKESNQLETFDVPPRGQPFKIVLDKSLR